MRARRMARPGTGGISLSQEMQSQEMQSQVEALRLTQSPLGTEITEVDHRRNISESLLSPSCELQGSSGPNPQLTRGHTGDGMGFYTSHKWTEFYPYQEVAVVTSIGQPSIPPKGYVPLRRGHCRARNTPEAAVSFKKDLPNGFSVDTLLWDEKLLEQRIMQLTAWTRRSPMPRRQKLDRINRMVNQRTFSTPLNTKL